jgi:hypothetical protein
LFLTLTVFLSPWVRFTVSTRSANRFRAVPSDLCRRKVRSHSCESALRAANRAEDIEQT